MNDFEVRLSAALARMRAGPPMPVAGLQRLTGGANMETWSFDCGGEGFILRRAPKGALIEERLFPLSVEAALMRAARTRGAPVAEIIGQLQAEDSLGDGFVMRRFEAEVRPQKILAAAPTGLLAEIAAALWHIHDIPIIDAPEALRRRTPAEQVAEMRERFVEYGADLPVFALATRWLEEHAPEPVAPRLVHGDFRMGNLMVSREGLVAVLDWELAHVGDPIEDLAWGCVNSWRFGMIDRPAFGLGDIEDFLRAYESASGAAVDRARFRFWLVYGTLSWGLICLMMTAIWRSGADPSIERLAIGRRASEAEVDLLMLLEEDAPASERSTIDFNATTMPTASGEPTTSEIAGALASWLGVDLRSRLGGRDRFLAAVAANALEIIGREATDSTPRRDAALSRVILDGGAGLSTPGLLKKLKASALRRLAVDQPKYSAFERARKLWTKS